MKWAGAFPVSALDVGTSNEPTHESPELTGYSRLQRSQSDLLVRFNCHLRHKAHSQKAGTLICPG
jgi:hypothetical protein